jgi:hypothetical protein
MSPPINQFGHSLLDLVGITKPQQDFMRRVFDKLSDEEVAEALQLHPSKDHEGFLAYFNDKARKYSQSIFDDTQREIRG